MSKTKSGASSATRLFVDISFWVGHAAFVAGLILVPDQKTGGASTNASIYPIVLIIVGVIAFISYFFAIGIFAKKMGRSPVIWGGLSFLFSPVGVWFSYVASFFISPKDKNHDISDSHSNVAMSTNKTWATYIFIAIGLSALAYVIYSIKSSGT